MNKSIVSRNLDQILIGNLITQLFIGNFDNISVFWEGFIQSLIIRKKSLKATNDKTAPEICRSLICQNCQMICKPYCWDKHHELTWQAVNGYELLLENDVSFFECFWRLHIDFISAKKTYFWEKRHLFRDVFETS